MAGTHNNNDATDISVFEFDDILESNRSKMGAGAGLP
jgi:hypothetical protein